jgi:hypothetical protein
MSVGGEPAGGSAGERAVSNCLQSTTAERPVCGVALLSCACFLCMYVNFYTYRPYPWT